MRKTLYISSILLPCSLVPAAPDAASHGDGKSPAATGPRVDLVLKKEEFSKFPQVQHPIALDVDEQGRVFVAETYRYEKRGIIDNRGKPKREMADLQMTTLEERERIAREWLASGELDKDLESRKGSYSEPTDGRANYLTKFSEKVACLVDENRDLHADKRTDFASGLNGILDGPAAGVLAWNGKVWLTCIPNLWLLEDKNQDLVAETKTSLARGFGIRNGWFGHDLHGLAMGMDGRIYFSVGDRGFNLRTKEGRVLSGPFTGGVFRCWPDGAELELVARGLRNPQELAFDDFGNLFTGDNNCDAGDKARIEFIVEGADYGWEVSYQDLQHRGPWLREKLWEMRPAKEDPSYPAWTIPPVGHLSAGPSGLAAYPGTGLPEKYAGHLFLCDFRGGGNGSIFAFKPDADGAGFKLADVHAIENGVGVSDVTFGYDGRMYVSDWGNAWDQNDAGRIYTMTHEESQKLPIVADVQKLAAEGMEKRSVAELCKLLDHQDRRIRMKAQQALAGKPVPEILERLLSVARKAATLPGRLHALWAVGMMSRANPVLLTEVVGFLKDESPEMRVQAAKILGDGKSTSSAPQLIALLKDPAPRVKLFAGLALAKLADPTALPALLAMAQENDDKDPMIRHAAVMGLAACSSAPELLEKTQAHASRAVRLAAVLALRKLEAGEIAKFLTDADPQIITEAARGIYDKQILSALPALAASLDRQDIPVGLRQEGFLRRAIEANYRLGKAEDAERVAKAAAMGADSGMPDAFRLVALEKLATWDNPEPREGVWGRWSVLPARPAGVARPAIKAHLPKLLTFAKGDVLTKAREVDNKFGAEKSPEALVALIRDETQPESLRLDYLRTLDAHGASTTAPTEEICKFILSIPQSSARLRTECRSILIKRQPATTMAQLNDAFLLGQPLEKQEAVMILSRLRTAESEKRLAELGNELVAGTLDPTIQVEVLEAVRHRDEKRSVWRKILEHYDERMEQGGDPLAIHRVALQGGDPDAGHTLFLNHQAAQCLRCHAVGGQGGIVGPDLKGVATRGNTTYLLESLVNPSAKVAEGFGIVSVTLNDGKSVAGVLQSKTDKGLTILEGTTPRVIPASEVKEMTPPMSGMPPMGALLTQRELRDILAYLQTLK